MIQRLLIIFCLFTSFLGCNKRAPIEWDANYSLPVAYGSLGINDLVNDTLTSLNADSSINIHFSRNLFQLDLDSLVEIPDNQLSNTFALPFAVAVDFNPGQTFINQPEEQLFEINNIELKEFSIASATLNYTLKSTIEGEVIYQYTVNSATDLNGNPFQVSITVPPAQNGISSQVNGTINIPLTNWNLEGISGNEINTLLTTVNVKISNNNQGPVTVSNLDTLQIDNEIIDLKTISARGYFGDQEISIGPDTTSINVFNTISAGTIDLDQITIDLRINNGIGADFNFLTNALSSQNNNAIIDLNHSLIGQFQNINRAYKIGNSITPSNYSSTINSSNSNINSMMENLPNALGYDLNIKLNPLGNISGHNDFIDKDFPFSFDLDFHAPLKFAANQLTLTDTITINLPDTSGINYGTIYLALSNGFPLSAELYISTTNSSDQLLTPGLIPAANVNANNLVDLASTSNHTISLNSNHIADIKTTKEIIISAVFNTANINQAVHFYDNYKIDFKISADFNATVTIP